MIPQHAIPHLSTIQPRTQAPSRFPCAHGNKSRPQDHQRTSRPRPRQAERV